MVTVVKYIGEYVEEQARVSLHSPLRVPSSSPSRLVMLVPRAFHRGVGAPSERHYCLGKDYKRAGQWIYGHWLHYCSATAWAAQRQCARGKRCKQRLSGGPHSQTYFLRSTLKVRHLDYQPVTGCPAGLQKEQPRPDARQPAWTTGKTSVLAVSYPQSDWHIHTCTHHLYSGPSWPECYWQCGCGRVAALWQSASEDQFLALVTTKESQVNQPNETKGANREKKEVTS